MEPVPSDPSADIVVHAPAEVERLSEIGLGWVMQREGVTLHVVLGYLSWGKWM